MDCQKSVVKNLQNQITGHARGRICQICGAEFCRKTRFKTEGILCVFQGFQTAALRQKNQRRTANDCESVPKNKKGRGETSPRTQTPFAAAHRQRIA
jgi:hypothetical protein